MVDLFPARDATIVVPDEGSESESSTPHRWWWNLLLYCWALLAIGTAIGAWTLATPLMGAPDEPAHAIDAAAVVRGQFDVAEHETRFGPLAYVQVPAWVASTPSLADCLGFFPEASAGCSPKLNNGTATMTSITQFSHNPPLYYLIVGTPSLLAKGAPAIYAMRMVGTLVNSSLIALGLFLVIRYHPRRRLFAGVLVALSPMVFFVSSVLNSSGLEIAAAFAAWCGGLCVIEHRPVPSALGGWTALAFAVLMLSRPASPANAAVIVLTLGIVAGWSRCKELARDRGTLPIRLSIVVTLIVACVQLAIGGFPPWFGVPVKPRSLWASVWLMLRLTEGRLRQAIGNFGWLNVPVPEAIFAVWSAAVAVLVAFGLYVSSRCRRALPALALAIVAMPMILGINTIGAGWQGRYWMPLLVGIPLVAASQLSAGEHSHGHISDQTGAIGVIALGLVLVIAQVWAFVFALQRYEYGLGAGPGTIAGWAPPGGAPLVTGMFVFGMILFLGFIAFGATSPKGLANKTPLRRVMGFSPAPRQPT